MGSTEIISYDFNLYVRKTYRFVEVVVVIDYGDVVVGIDVVSSGVKLSDYRYALAVLKDGTMTVYDDVGLGRLIRLLWELKPKLIALDNIMELGGSKKNVVKIVKLLPPESELVQVTLSADEFVDLRKLASKAGIVLEHGKLTPQKTAEVLAILSSKGYGKVLKLFEDRVKVVISRGRVPGSGGSSSERFKRGLRTSVLSAVKRFKEELDSRGIDYDLTFRESDGGIERAVFTIYTRRSEISSILRVVKGFNVSIRVKPVLKKKFLSLVSSNLTTDKFIIVGVDPGIETGLAIVDLDLNPLLVLSSKNLDREEILQIIRKYGIPVLVSTDKNPPPEIIEKLAASLNTVLYCPSRTLSTAEKDSLVYEYVEIHKLNLKTTHERDALASCLKAYKEYEEKFLQLTSKLNEIGLHPRRLQKYKAEIIRGRPIAEVVEEMINDYISKGETYGKENIVRMIKLLVNEDIERRDKELIAEMEKIAKERDVLRKRVVELERQLTQLETELHLRTLEFNSEVAKDREISELRHRLRKLTEHLSSLEEQVTGMTKLIDSLKEAFNLLFNGKYLIVRSIRKLSVEEILRSSQTLGSIKEGELIFVKELREFKEDLMKLINSLKLRILIPKPLEEHKDIKSIYQVVVYPCRDYIEVSDDVVLIPKEVINELEKYEEELRKEIMKKSEFTLEKLLNLIEEYRTKRTINISNNSN
jgi:predicted RNase H-like nuclease (RuvC/YqgF family)